MLKYTQKKKFKSYKNTQIQVYLMLLGLNNRFRYLNNTTRFFTILFHLHVFSQYLNNITRRTLSNIIKQVLNFSLLESRH